MNKPTVSIIMPAYNCAIYVEKAIESVKQQKVSWELIIIDDFSTDGTQKQIEPYLIDDRIRYYRNEKNRGVSESRNIGVSHAGGMYIAYLDADDWWEEKKLAKQLERLEHADGVFCYTGRELVAQNGRATGKIISVPEELTYKELLCTNVIPCSSVLLKAEVAREFHMEHDELHEDYLNWLRIIKKYERAYGVNEPLLKSRLTDNGKSRNKQKTFKMTYGVYRNMGESPGKAMCFTARHLYKSIFRYLG